jgi:hypothetical protein
MRCPGCGTTLDSDAKSCPKCGRLIIVGTRDRLYAETGDSHIGSLDTVGKGSLIGDTSEQSIDVIEEDDVTEGSELASQLKDYPPLEIVESSVVVDESSIKFDVTKGILVLDDKALYLEKPEKKIEATPLEENSAKSSDKVQKSSEQQVYGIFLEVTREHSKNIQHLSSMEASFDRVEATIKGSDTSTTFRVDFRWLSLDEMPMSRDKLLDLLELYRKKESEWFLVPIATVEVFDGKVTSIEPYTSEDTRYSDILKPHRLVRIKGAGTRMDTDYFVTAVHHEIGSSNQSDSTSTTRCSNCGREIESTSKFCRDCGARSNI